MNGLTKSYISINSKDHIPQLPNIWIIAGIVVKKANMN